MQQAQQRKVNEEEKVGVPNDFFALKREELSHSPARNNNAETNIDRLLLLQGFQENEVLLDRNEIGGQEAVAAQQAPKVAARQSDDETPRFNDKLSEEDEQ